MLMRYDIAFFLLYLSEYELLCYVLSPVSHATSDTIPSHALNLIIITFSWSRSLITFNSIVLLKALNSNERVARELKNKPVYSSN